MPSLLESRRPWLWFTLGPATIDLVDEALLAGANGVRYTLSYATPALHIERALTVAGRASALGVDVYAIADLPGEKFRLASFPGEKIEVHVRDRIRLGTSAATDVEAPVPVLPLQSEDLLTSANYGSRIVVGDGGVELQVEDIDPQCLTCEVVRGGTIEHNRGLTLIGGRTEPRSLTPTDTAMLEEVAAAKCFDAIALSFVSDPADLRRARGILSGFDHPVPLIAKIETRRGVERLAEICQEADVVMAARGDLALAIDPSMLYAAVMEIAHAASAADKPWLLATQLLEGLDYLGFPTRAELTDVVGWMHRGAAGAMLSRETVFGGRPIESIQFLRALLAAPLNWSTRS